MDASLRQQQHFAGVTLRQRGMRLGRVPKRDSTFDRYGQFARLHGLNHMLQVLRVLLGYESDRARLRMSGSIGRSARPPGYWKD